MGSGRCPSHDAPHGRCRRKNRLPKKTLCRTARTRRSTDIHPRQRMSFCLFVFLHGCFSYFLLTLLSLPSSSSLGHTDATTSELDGTLVSALCKFHAANCSAESGRHDNAVEAFSEVRREALTPPTPPMSFTSAWHRRIFFSLDIGRTSARMIIQYSYDKSRRQPNLCHHEKYGTSHLSQI